MHRSTDEDAGGREQRDRGREVRNGAAIPVSIGKTDYPAAEILEELRKITQSPQFRHCTRGKQFLDYVVREKLLGRTENLKERSIGVAVFRRAAVYATGDDPVVRVQAREVRRRLDQYYRDRSNSGSIRIDLPTGSYVPEFMRPNTTPQEVPAPGQPGTPASSPPTPFAGGGPVVPRNWWKAGFFSLVVVVIVASAVSLLVRTTGSGSVAGERGAPAQPVNSNNAVNRFWAPVLGTSQPVMIYLAKGVSYRPSADIYQSYAKSHHGAFSLQVQQANQPLPLSPDTKLEWKQMILYTDFGVAVGDVNVAVRLATLFGGMNKPEQLRIGKNFSYADLSSAPTVLVGLSTTSGRWI